MHRASEKKVGRPRHRAKPAHAPAHRRLSRRVLLAAALEEFRSGDSGLAALYASLLARAIVDIEPGLAEEFSVGLAVIEN
jgi:hypothetical protein